MRVVGLTGSIGSGKTEAARIFEQLGAYTLDADDLARQVVRPASDGLQAIAAAFGPQVLMANGELNRSYLAELVFADPDKRIKLEEIVHPRIRALFRDKLAECAARTPSPHLLVYVVPLLYESGNQYPELQAVIAVVAPRDLCVRRVEKRDGCSQESAGRIFDIQLPPEAKERLARYVLRNTGTLSDLRKAVESLYVELQASLPPCSLL